MTLRRTRIALVTGVLLLGSCTDRIANPIEEGTPAELRLFHVDPSRGAVDVEVAGSPVIRGVTFGNSSPIVLVKGGAQQLVLKSNGVVTGTLDAQLETGRLNSMVVSAAGPALSATVEPDTAWTSGPPGTSDPSRAYIRMVIVATTNTAPPTQLSARAKGPGVPTDSIMTFGLDATVGRHGSLMAFDPGTFTWEYVAAGTTSPVLAGATFAVAGGEKKAVVLSRGADGRYHVDIVVEK